MPGVEQGIDRLFELPLEEFTSARNEFARQLKQDGNTEEAEAVQALTKPSVAAWTVNQLARTDADGVRQLLDAGEALRSAQARLLAGQDASDSLREATAQEREALRSLTESACALLQDAGRQASTAMVERIAATLRAAAVDDEGRRLLEAGRLTAELEPAGFGGLTGAPVPTPQRKLRTRNPSASEKRRERKEEQQRRLELRERARELEREARAAEREAERAEAAAETARSWAEEARTEADEAAKEAEAG